ncbi:MAG: M1 family metallopeptidase [Ilumatobacter sp.]|uniref:M1 family metallopeptidase n=1 Tax=Ilumatobacter sp. TaxID=1967498 RepID=UPI003C792EE8
MYKIAGFLIAALVTVAACGADSDRAAISVDSERIVGDAPTIPTDPELPVDVDDEIEEDTGQAPQQSGSTPRTTTPPTTEGASRGDATESTADAGATTLNDPYVGDFGNGGYDVESYDLEIEWDPDSTRLDGAATIVAIATQELSAFNLELTGFDVSSVEIDGEPATFVRDDDELMIVPRSEPIPNGETFTTVIEYAGTPVDNEFIAGEVGRPSGWHTRDGFVFVAGEPLSASTFHPANDHPSDKASFTYRITAPSDLTVAANGTLEDTTTVTDDVAGNRTTWTFVQPDPQATYLTTLVIGDFTVIDDGTSDSGVPVRNVIDTELVDELGPIFDAQPEMIDAFEELFGPYPFEVYGSVVVNDSFGGALETQTLSIFGTDVVGFGDGQAIVAHELAHQWFGNSVSVERWEDIWLNEGFASYGEALWSEASDPDFSYDRWIRRLLRAGPALERHVQDPGPGELFSPQVYLRGAFTLHALRVRVGDEVFFDILQTWNERFGGANASTDDFQSLSEELSGEELDEFFDEWLRTEALPDELDGVPLI